MTCFQGEKERKCLASERGAIGIIAKSHTTRINAHKHVIRQIAFGRGERGYFGINAIEL